jgi:hypothetical protein
MHVRGTGYVYPRLYKPAETALQPTGTLKEILMHCLSLILISPRVDRLVHFQRAGQKKWHWQWVALQHDRVMILSMRHMLVLNQHRGVFHQGVGFGTGVYLRDQRSNPKTFLI